MPGFRDRSVKLASAFARNLSAVSRSACSPRYTYCSTKSRLALARLWTVATSDLLFAALELRQRYLADVREILLRQLALFALQPFEQ